jgi:NAD(P)H-hydrate epimerase
MLKHKLLARRKKGTHKGDYGRVLIVAGSSGMLGAAVLSSRGAIRVGAGLTYLAVPSELVNFANTLTPEVITLPFEKIGTLKPNALAIGPGLSIGNDKKKLVLGLLAAHSSSLTAIILDADGLNNIAENSDIFSTMQFPLIITPHPGELSRLIKKGIDEIGANRVEMARSTAARFNCIVVLKGYKTVIADPTGKVYVNNSGNPGMAKGGMGDVLTGMIAGIAGQGVTAFDAAVMGVYYHGLAGDLAAKDEGEYGMIASDLLEKIPNAIQKGC